MGLWVGKSFFRLGLQRRNPQRRRPMRHRRLVLTVVGDNPSSSSRKELTVEGQTGVGGHGDAKSSLLPWWGPWRGVAPSAH